MAASVLLAAATLSFCVLGSEAAEFLSAEYQGETVPKEVVEQVLLSDLRSSSNSRWLALKDKLAPSFAALPKNSHGFLEPSTVRYVLHRHFSQEHGWRVRGLDPEGAGWKSADVAPAADIMKGLAPLYIQELFMKRSEGRGLDLDELASFAATMDDLIFQESLGGLQGVYTKLGFSTEQVSEEQFDIAIRVFLSDLICGDYSVFNGLEDLDALEAKAKDFYPEYDDIIMWYRDLHHTREFLSKPSRNPFIQDAGVSFDYAGEFLRELLHHFGALSEAECRTLKDDLSNVEQPGTGRILLSDFYNEHSLQFHESVEYLRNQGALENETGTPHVIIANYITGPSRCMPFSSYYSICCPDECEGLLASLEHAIGHPEATAADIAALVSALPSDTVDAPRNLSAPLIGRLDDIARHHNGLVPLHGRLFMQWMHHAYPRECPYPHSAGTTSPVTQDEWLRMNPEIEDAMVTSHEKAMHVRKNPSAKPLAVEELPWSELEELVASHQKRQERSSASAYLRIAACILAVVSFALSMPKLRASKADEKIHHFV